MALGKALGDTWGKVVLGRGGEKRKLWKCKSRMWSFPCGTVEMNLTGIHEDVCSIPGLARGLRMRHCCELWCRLAAAAQVQPLATALPYTSGVTLKSTHTHTSNYTLTILKYSSVALRTLTALCTHHHHPAPEYFHLLKLKLHPVNTNSPSPYSPSL